MVTLKKLKESNLPREHELKYRRMFWVEMINQLRFGAPGIKDILPGECQSILDWLAERASIPKKLRYETHLIDLKSDTAEALMAYLPDWADTPRIPHSEEGHPIFYKQDDCLIYLDGRRRINVWYREDPQQKIKYWVIEDEV
ncbi:MAG: hypothetical protein KAI73_11525 [Rhodospirillaceae bacterium]|nr:hypothetical protein [Rhodospirillaceae bacterium]